MKYVLLYAALAAAGLLCLLQMGRVAELEDKNNRLSVELAHAQIPMQRDTIRDTVEVVTQTVVEVVPKKMKEALAADQQLIKDLQLKVKQLEAVQTTVLQVGDTVPAQYRPHDSIFTYHDQCRHHFLWWKWGTRGYRLKIANFNPHARVIYNKYIKAGK